MAKRLFAEFFGTFWLVLGGCGSAVLAAVFPNRALGFQLGIGFEGVALAFGLTVLTMVYAVGHISGAHFNPAVSFGLASANRFSWRDVPGYVVAQLLGGTLGAAVLYFIASGTVKFDVHADFAANGYGAHSPGGYALGACFLCEVVMTFFFLMIILGSTHQRAPKGFAPIAIGFGLTLIHLISIPVTNTSVNPARSTAVAVFCGGWAIGQLWMFWVAPIIGGVLGGVVHHALFEKTPPEPPITGEAVA